jgi:hypothetical protein
MILGERQLPLTRAEATELHDLLVAGPNPSAQASSLEGVFLSTRAAPQGLTPNLPAAGEGSRPCAGHSDATEREFED